MGSQLEKFANKHFDSALEPFLKGLKQYFGLSTKGSFVFLAGYGLKFPESYQDHFNDAFNFDGPEWREEQDGDYMTAVDVLIETYSASSGFAFKDVRTDRDLLGRVIDNLMKIANSVGAYWLSGDMMSFKKGVSYDGREYFIKMVAAKLNELNKDMIPF